MTKKILTFLSLLLVVMSCSEPPAQNERTWRLCVDHYRAESYLVATKICRQAAEQGIAHAAWLLGHIFYYDLAEKESRRAEGFEWYLKAAEGGWGDAQTYVGESYFYADDVEADYEKSYFWLKKAAETHRDPFAEFTLGMHYYEGKGQVKDLNMAIQWFKKAAIKSHLMSVNNLTWIYATSDDQTVLNLEQALFWMAKLDTDLADENENKPVFLDTKAAVHALDQNYELAIKLQTDAIALLPQDIAPERLAEYKRHLTAYQNQQPWLENDSE